MGKLWARIGLVALLTGLVFGGIAPGASADDPPLDPAAEPNQKYPAAVIPQGIQSDIAWEHIAFDQSTASYSEINASLIERLDEQAGYQTVFPPDERERVTPTTSFPARAVSMIIAFGANDSTGGCTGTFIGPQVVLTAAHCLYNSAFGGWAYDIAVVPGKDGDVDPYGYELAYDAYIPNGWAETGDPRYDFGLIILGSPNLGNQVGWLRIGDFTSETLSHPNLGIATIGYPADKPFGTQWYGAKPSIPSGNESFLGLDLDLYAGQSGSAIWRQRDGVIIGVISGEGPNDNLAVRINSDVMGSILGICQDIGCRISYYVEPLSYAPIDQVWARTDKPVIDAQVRRTWMWGPQSFTPALVEPYSESPGGNRTVFYFDKSRMEITDPFADTNNPWYVTNGLLATELVTGRMQFGNYDFLDLAPAQVNIAGDANDPNGPTYATFNSLLWAQPIPMGWSVSQRVNRAGQVWDDPSLSGQGVTAAVYVPETGHNVASVFWQFMTSSGLVLQNDQLVTSQLFENAYYATGYPITEAYWTTVRVGGVEKQVLVQAFERRVLTYTPDNPDGWKVEAGNVGQHYYSWRYGQ